MGFQYTLCLSGCKVINNTSKEGTCATTPLCRMSKVMDVKPAAAELAVNRDDLRQANPAQEDLLVQPDNARPRNTLHQRLLVGHARQKFSSSGTNCRYFSPPEDTPHHEGATHRQNVPYRPDATGPTGTDPTRPPRPNACNRRTSRTLGGGDDGVPAKVLAGTQQPHAWTSQNRAHHKKTRPSGNN